MFPGVSKGPVLFGGFWVPFRASKKQPAPLKPLVGVSGSKSFGNIFPSAPGFGSPLLLSHVKPKSKTSFTRSAANPPLFEAPSPSLYLEGGSFSPSVNWNAESRYALKKPLVVFWHFLLLLIILIRFLQLTAFNDPGIESTVVCKKTSFSCQPGTPERHRSLKFFLANGNRFQLRTPGMPSFGTSTNPAKGLFQKKIQPFWKSLRFFWSSNKTMQKVFFFKASTKIYKTRHTVSHLENISVTWVMPMIITIVIYIVVEEKHTLK